MKHQIKAVLALAILAVMLPLTCLTQERAPAGAAELLVSSLVQYEADKAEIEQLWKNFDKAVRANDVETAVGYFGPNDRETYKHLFEILGSDLSVVTRNLRSFEVKHIGPEIATYTVVEKSEEGDRLHTVYFIKHPDLGWVIREL